MPDEPKRQGLYAALAAAQAEIGRAMKDSYNPHFKSRYADLASVMDACMPALTRHGIAVLQPPYDDETGRYIKTVFVHGESGESIECRVPLIVSKNDMQGYGSASTYARRYGLMGMAGIAPEDDDGNAAAKAKPPEAPAQPTIPPEVITATIKRMSDAPDLSALQARWNDLSEAMQQVPEVRRATNVRKKALREAVANGDDNQAPPPAEETDTSLEDANAPFM